MSLLWFFAGRAYVIYFTFQIIPRRRVYMVYVIIIRIPRRGNAGPAANARMIAPE